MDRREELLQDRWRSCEIVKRRSCEGVKEQSCGKAIEPGQRTDVFFSLIPARQGWQWQPGEGTAWQLLAGGGDHRSPRTAYRCRQARDSYNGQPVRRPN